MGAWSDVRVNELRRMLEIEILGEDGARTAGKVERRLHGKAGLLPTAEAALVYG
jgi:hypothetical protein